MNHAVLQDFSLFCCICFAAIEALLLTNTSVFVHHSVNSDSPQNLPPPVNLVVGDLLLLISLQQRFEKEARQPLYADYFLSGTYMKEEKCLAVRMAVDAGPSGKVDTFQTQTSAMMPLFELHDFQTCRHFLLTSLHVFSKNDIYTVTGPPTTF